MNFAPELTSVLHKAKTLPLDEQRKIAQEFEKIVAQSFLDLRDTLYWQKLCEKLALAQDEGGTPLAAVMAEMRSMVACCDE